MCSFLKLKANLPSGFLMKSTINANYQSLRRLYFQRRNHRLYQWHQICEWIEGLPYSKELIIVNEKD